MVITTQNPFIIFKKLMCTLRIKGTLLNLIKEILQTVSMIHIIFNGIMLDSRRRSAFPAYAHHGPGQVS